MFLKIETDIYNTIAFYALGVECIDFIFHDVLITLIIKTKKCDIFLKSCFGIKMNYQR